jgi:hypothetical protein
MTVSDRGLSRRQAGAQCSSKELHNWSAYELREELKKRGYFLDDYRGPINYEILLKKLTLLICEENDEKERLRLENICKELDLNRNYSSGQDPHSQRFARKQEALERSRLRLMNADYFKTKKMANEEGLNTFKCSCDASSKQDLDMESSDPSDRGDQEKDLFQHKHRPQIGGRCV